MSEFNIKSTTIEKGLELAKEFLGKLISPTVEELGLLVSDNIRFLRFKNQLNILLKAKAYVENKNINLKELPIKILVPLIEHASLEENESMQDKWAIMLANMVDSNTNMQNHIFPFILSQVSIEEFRLLENLLTQEKEYEVNRHTYYKLQRENRYIKTKEIWDLGKIVVPIEQRGFSLNAEKYEIANIQRLGLIRQMPPRIIIEEVPTSDHEDNVKQFLDIDAQYDNDDYGFRITELAEKFLEVCEIKN